MRPYALLLLVGVAAAARAAAPAGLPAAIFTDPPHDAAHPATMSVLHVPSGGGTFNAVAYLPAGAGPHPVLVLCHGLPGNEKNLDLAQAARRAGWVAVTFNYRGSWGSPGTYSFAGNFDDVNALLAYLRNPAHAAELHADPARTVLAGHSLGGWVAAWTGEHDRNLAGVVLISAADLSREAKGLHPEIVALMADNMETLAGVTAESLAADLEQHGPAFPLAADVGALKDTPLLVLTSDDGLAPHSDALVAAVRAGGGRRVTTAHVATDHGWSDRRIELEGRILDWLARLPRAPAR